MRYVQAMAIAIVLFFWCGNTYGSTRTIVFNNGSNVNVDDLHIEFNQETTVTANPFGSDRQPVKNDMPDNRIHNFWGMNLGVNQEVTFSFSSITQDLTIDRWWWTLGGTATNDGARRGIVGGDTGGKKLSFLDLPATGDGALLVNIDGVGHVFTPTSGFSAVQSTLAFDSFLSGLKNDGFSLIAPTVLASNTVEFVGNLLGDPQTELSVEIIRQDSTQQFVLAPIESIPEPSSVLLLVSGLVTLIVLGKKRVEQGRQAGEMPLQESRQVHSSAVEIAL